jgi:hypothetical protein
MVGGMLRWNRVGTESAEENGGLPLGPASLCTLPGFGYRRSRAQPSGSPAASDRVRLWYFVRIVAAGRKK